MELDKDVLAVALSKAITDAVPAEMQKEIFTRALRDHLFRSERAGDRPALSHAFERALNEATQELARKVLEEPENQEKVRAAFREMLDQLLADGVLIRKWTDKILGAIRY